MSDPDGFNPCIPATHVVAARPEPQRTTLRCSVIYAHLKIATPQHKEPAIPFSSHVAMPHTWDAILNSQASKAQCRLPNIITPSRTNAQNVKYPIRTPVVPPLPSCPYSARHCEPVHVSQKKSKSALELNRALKLVCVAVESVFLH